jgi:hypothetical protein
VVVHVLEQAPAHEHVDGLEAATDPQDGHAALAGGDERIGLQLVAAGFDFARAVLGLAVAVGMEVGTTGQEQPVHGLEGSPARSLGAGLIERQPLAAGGGQLLEVARILAPREVGVGGTLRRLDGDHDARGGGRAGRVPGRRSSGHGLMVRQRAAWTR